MTIPIEIVVLFLGAMLSLQGWTLAQLIKMQVQIATLTQRLNDQNERLES